MERAEIIAQVEGEGGICFSASSGTQLTPLGEGRFKISVPLPERRGTAHDAMTVFVSLSWAVFYAADHVRNWAEGLGLAVCGLIAFGYLIAFFRRSETIRAFWRGLTGKRA